MRGRRALAALWLGLLLAAAPGSVQATSGRASGPAVGNGLDPALQIVFMAHHHGPTGNIFGSSALYTLRADGSSFRQVSPPDGRYYDWPTFAMNGTAIVYSSSGPSSPQQSVYMSNLDGTHEIRLSSNPWMDAQPKISPDGSTVLFTSEWSEFPKVALYRMNLPNLQVENLTARTFGAGIDSDPKYSADGKTIVFASSYSATGPTNTQIWLMNADGTGRRRVTYDNFFNTDPAISPDGRYVVYSSYQGKNQPIPGELNQGFTFSTADWHIMRVDLKTGQQKSLTQGRDCTRADPTQPCTPTEGSAWVPNFSPDGKQIGFQTVLSPLQAGLFVVDADGTNPRPLFAGPDLAISYWDWAMPGKAPPGAMEAIGKSFPNDRLLFGGAVFDTGAQPPPSLLTSTPDRWLVADITPPGIRPTFARWSPDRKHIVFTAKVPVDHSKAKPYPAPPPGKSRITHFTLADLTDFVQPVQDPDQLAQDQIFIMDADGSHLRQLTTPWIEDWMDGLVDSDSRGNLDPDLSPDGRYVVFTNTSTIRLESFILRLDLQTGEVINLTNVTAGAVPTADAMPRWSPDGKTIAFTSVIAGNAHVYVMNMDGTQVRVLTDDDNYNTFPTWAPDGKTIAFSSFRGAGLPEVETGDFTGDIPVSKLRLDSWVLGTVNVATGAQTTLTSIQSSPAFRPVYAPDGSRIAYITLGLTRAPDIYLVNADGSNQRPLQLTITTKEEYVDWR